MNLQLFPRYMDFSPKVPVYCLTPAHGATIHRFFDTSPISPDQRYLACCVLPYEDHQPEPNDRAQILLTDLDTGEERVIGETSGWGIQVGANLQWGRDSHTLFYNDVDTKTWQPKLVRHDIQTGDKERMGEGIFMLSPDGQWALTHNLVKSRITQAGYGVAVPDEYVSTNSDDPQDDGFFLTNVRTGESRLMMPLHKLLHAGEMDLKEYAGGEFYGFQCKWSPDGKRIMYVVRWLPKDHSMRRAMVFTSDIECGDIHLALCWREWAKGGHHVNWHPDSEHITMNLIFNSRYLKFVSFRYDGNEFHALSDTIFGSGHPSFHRDGRFLVTDAYVDQDLYTYPDGTTTIRLIDVQEQTQKEIVRIRTRTGYDQDLRLDPHPAWSRDWRYVTFNGYADGTRRVYICDMQEMLKG